MSEIEDTVAEMWADISALSPGWQVVVGFLIGSVLVCAVLISTYKGPR